MNNNDNESNDNHINNPNISGHNLLMSLLQWFGLIERSGYDQSESSFFSFNQNNNTINGSTEFSISDSKNDSNIQLANESINDSLNKEKQNLSQELLIYSGVKN